MREKLTLATIAKRSAFAMAGLDVARATAATALDRWSWSV